MNKFLRVLGLGLMIATLAFVGFAQDRTRDIVYKDYTDNFQSTEASKLQIALNAAKEYVSKFPDDADQVTYFKDAIPTLEQSITKLKEQNENAAAAAKESKEWYALLGDFTNKVKAKNWADVFLTGKTIIDKQLKYLDQNTVKGQKLDVATVMGVIGFDRAVEKTDTYNNDAINYLKQSIQQIEAGQTSTYGKVLGYDLMGKDNALGLLNYYIGYILYYRQNKKDEAYPYLYKATKYNSASKDFAAIYQVIGLNYYDKIAELDKDRLAKVAANNNADNEETLALLAQEKGYADRGIEAYARALKVATADPKTSQAYKDGLRTSLEEIYKFRYDKTDGLDAYMNSVMNKPLTDPATTVQPVVEEKKVDTTTTTTTSTTPPTTPSTIKPATTQMTTKTTETKTTPMANGAKTTTKSTETKTTPMANGAKTTTKTTTTTKTEAKTPVKKPRKR